MKKKYQLFLSAILFIYSCGTDDGLTPLNIETSPDTITIAQNTEIEIFIFQNDDNIPSSGELSISNPAKGGATILDPNNTPNNPSDDLIHYNANANEIGIDVFEYTICNTAGTCITETINITITSNSEVIFNLANAPYQTLSEYQFFEGDLKNLEPTFGVIPYSLNSTLFTDYAKKKRFIWVPNNSKANYISDDVLLNFPTGTVLIKNFYYDNVLPNLEQRIIETRLMIRKSDNWAFADYVWNAAQTEAVLDMNGSFVDLQWEENNELKTVQYRIPSEAECLTCHKISEIAQPIGTKPRNLNLTYNYADGQSNQLDKLIAIGYLENNLPGSIATLPDYNDTSQPLELRARAYLEINCAHCHSEETHCAYRPMRFDFTSTQDAVNYGLCVDPDTDLGLGLGHIVEPGDARNSVLHFRLSTSEASNRMPLLGRTLMHSEGITLIEQWIDSLTPGCN